MKFAHVATKWIGTGVPPDDKYRLDMPPGIARKTDAGSQFINLAKNCPSPNIGLVLVTQKDGDYIDSLKAKVNQVVLETWEDDGSKTQVASALKLKNFLIRQGMGEELANLIGDFEPEGPRGRTEALLEELTIADKRSRRRMELGL